MRVSNFVLGFTNISTISVFFLRFFIGFSNSSNWDDTHMTSIKTVQFSIFHPPSPLVHLHPKFFHPLDLERPISIEHSLPLQMIINQLNESIIQGWLLYVIRSFLQAGFHFQYQLINLFWLSFNFLSCSWTLIICFFVALHFCVCSCPKISRNAFHLYLFHLYCTSVKTIQL